MKRKFVYVGSDCIKTFRSFRRMRVWAMDEAHNGNYYISCPNITFKKSQTEVMHHG